MQQLIEGWHQWERIGMNNARRPRKIEHVLSMTQEEEMQFARQYVRSGVERGKLWVTAN